MERKIKNPWLRFTGYNCIGCCPDNPIGLHLEFFEDGDDIVAHWKPTQNHQGWINVLHGGVQALMIDEASGWVVARKLSTTAVTSKMNVQYLKSIYTDDEGLTIRSRISKMMRNVAFIETEIWNGAGELCTKAELIFFCQNKEKVAQEIGFTGCDLED